MTFDLVEIWHEMGIIGRLVTVTLFTMSIWSIGVMVERAVTFFVQRSRAKAFAHQLAGLLEAGKVQQARAAAAESRCYLGALVEAGLNEYLKCDDRELHERLGHTESAMERAELRETQRLKRGQGVLGTVGSTAPFVGLLGTTMGIVSAFERMAETGGGGLGAISAAIGESLLNTALGLIVAIPAVIAFNYFTGRLEAAGVDMSEVISELVDYLHRERVEPPAASGAATKAATVKAS
ncbi:MAG: MotA/TolQ/ExbB proton channel family protein [Deltaproteobacteria bacterium]|nr:MAG: MotA/TolQ/ExbB proton channel family protein [Deltaproteobacteria bacterium]